MSLAGADFDPLSQNLEELLPEFTDAALLRQLRGLLDVHTVAPLPPAASSFGVRAGSSGSSTPRTSGGPQAQAGFAVLMDESVTGDNIAAGEITAVKIAAGTITATQLSAGSVTADKIAAGAVTAGKIAANAVTAAEIAAGSITTTKLAAGAVTANEIAADAVTSAKINAGAVTTTKLAAGAVTATELAAGAVTAGKIAANAVTATEIAAGSITTTKLAAGAVTATELAAGSVTTAKIVAGAITATEIAASAVTSGKINALAVTTAKIAAGAITATEIAADAITAAKIIAGAVGNTELATDAVTNVKVNDVSGGKITAGTVADARLPNAMAGHDYSANSGAAGTPSFAFDASVTTGIYWDGTYMVFYRGDDVLKVSTAGTWVGDDVHATPGSTWDVASSAARFATIYCVTLNQSSDRRLKTDIADAPLGLGFVRSLRPRSFRWKDTIDTQARQVADAAYDEAAHQAEVRPLMDRIGALRRRQRELDSRDPDAEAIENAVAELRDQIGAIDQRHTGPHRAAKQARRPGRRLHYGLVAQEVKEALDAAGEDAAFWQRDERGEESLDYTQLVPVLIRAVQELAGRVDNL